MSLLIWLFQEIFYLSAAASVILLLLLAVKRVFHKALSPRWHYLLWVLLLVRLSLPISPQSPLSIYNLFNAAAERANLPAVELVNPLQNAPADGSEEEAAGGSGLSAGFPGLNDAGQTGQNAGPEAEGTLNFGSVIKIAAVVWLAGMAVMGLYTVYINIAFAVNVRKRYKPLKDARIEQILEDCKTALRLRRAIPLLTSGKARTPSLYGLFYPRILVSEATLNKLDDAEIKYVFLHELTHCKRKDIAVNWFLTLLKIVYFFNPLIWYAFKKIQEDCEISCDADSLRYVSAEEVQPYGSTIIKLLQLCSNSALTPVTAGLLNSKSSIKRRIHMIKGFKRKKWQGTILAVGLIAAIGLFGLTSCTQKQPPVDDAKPEISDTPNAENTASPDVETNEPEVSAPSESPAADNSDAGSESETPDPSPDGHANYLGEWTVQQVLAYGSAGTYSKEDAEKMVGKSLSFSEDEASIINDQPSEEAVVIKNPGYQETELTKDDFLAGYRMSFDQLGIDADTILQVAVSGSDGTGGCMLLIVDADTMILAAGGTYFELAK